MNNAFTDFGVQVAAGCVTQGDFKALKRITTDANSTDARIRQGAYFALDGVMAAFSGVLDRVTAAGIKITGVDIPTREAARYALASGPAELSRVLQTQINTVAALRKKYPDWLAKFEITPAPATRADAPAPQKVEIVGLPARKTTTEIERNGAGEITSSMQVESDF